MLMRKQFKWSRVLLRNVNFNNRDSLLIIFELFAILNELRLLKIFYRIFLLLDLIFPIFFTGFSNFNQMQSYQSYL